MEPRGMSVEELALFDPISAYAEVMGIPRVPVELHCTASFATDAETTPVQLIAPVDTVSDTVHRRTWVDKIDFSLQSPALDSGIMLSSLFNACLKQQPNMGVKVSIEPEPRYVVASQFTPLENFVNVLGNNRWPSGWLLRKQQHVRMIFIPTAQPPSTPDQPYVITTSFTGWQFLDPTLEWITRAEACKRLRAKGIETYADQGDAVNL